MLDAGSLVILALPGWYAVRGAGAVSIDRVIARGLGDSALPLAAPVMRMLAWVSRELAPFWLLAMRLWLAATLLVAGGWSLGSAEVLPLGLFGLAVQSLVLPLAVLPAQGLAMPLTMLPVRVTLVDRNNYHLFQPLLYQIATAALSPADVATPIRSLFATDGNVRVLAAFPEVLCERAMGSLAALGVEILLDSRVTGIDGSGVMLGSGQTIQTETVLWGAGVVASPAARWLGCEADRSGRVVVDDQLRVAGLADVFAIGDTAASSGWQGKPVPGLAPAAKQAGEHFAKAVEQALRGRTLAGFRNRVSVLVICPLVSDDCNPDDPLRARCVQRTRARGVTRRARLSYTARLWHVPGMVGSTPCIARVFGLGRAVGPGWTLAFRTPSTASTCSG